MAIGPGSRLGPYEVTALIGEGGMGKVWRAHHTGLKRDDALKVLPDAFASDPERLARFQREAQVLASLNHPNIAHVHGLEHSNGVQALVMELVEGPTLADRIAQGPIPVDEALPIARQIAEALEAAHEQGIIHRDLKPANIKVKPDGTVKVLDFGLAKAMEPTGGMSANASISPTITSPAMMTGVGVLLGTAAYMSPEQARGKAVDKRTDVWAFGCVLYEMLTGKRAFEGDDVSDTLAAVLRAQPDWTALPPMTPPAVAVLITRCLEKDRAKRIGDIAVAQFLLNAPDTGLATVPLTTMARTPSRRRIAALVAAAMLLMAITGTATWWAVSRGMSSPTVARFSFQLPEGQQLTNTGRAVVAISPDGSLLGYVANSQVYLRSISELEARPIPGTFVKEGILHPVFSPDGRSIAFYSLADNAIKRISVTGGVPVTICSADLVFGMSWDAGGILYGSGGNGIFRVSPNGGKPEQLVRVNGEELAHGPQLLPDGRTVLFTLAEGTAADRWDRAKIVVQSLGSGARKTVVDGGSDGRYLSTGHLVYALRGTLLAVPFAPDRQEVLGGAVPVVEGVRRSIFNTGTAHLVVSDTGSLLYVTGPVSGPGNAPRTLFLTDRTGATTPLSIPSGRYVHPRVSRDGTRLAVATDDGQEAIIWIYDLRGTAALRRLTFGARDRFPVWSPDGTWITFQSDRERDRAIFRQRSDGTGAPERLTKPEPDAAHIPESWSPDGKHLLFAEAKNSRFALWVWSASDRTAHPFGNVESGDPLASIFSPDGRWVAYDYNPGSGGLASPDRGVYVQPFPATGARYQVPKESNDFHPTWAADGASLFFLPTGARFAEVSVQLGSTVTFGRTSSHPGVFAPIGGSTSERDYDILPDGRFIGTALAQDSPDADLRPEIRIVLNWFEELKRLAPTN